MPIIDEKIEYDQEKLFQKVVQDHPELASHLPKHHSRKQLNIMVCGEQGTGKSSFVECLLKLVDFKQTNKLH